MNHSFVMRFSLAIALLLVMTIPASAESSAISSISPSVAYLGTTTTVTVTGTDFNTSSVKVKLIRDDESNITATVSSLSSTTIVCKFSISSSKETGSWDFVVVNEDDSEVVKVDGFSLRNAITLTSISPVVGQTDNESVEFTLTGTGLSDAESVYLYNSDYDNVTATIDDVDSTEVTGEFNLDDIDEDTYKVCVLDSAGTRKCGLSFEVTTDQLGIIDISSSPSSAAVYVDGTYYGTSPCTVEDLTEGSHKVLIEKTGYSDWGKFVKVTSGGTTTVDADLEAITTAPTTVPTTAPTAMPTTEKPPQNSGTVKQQITAWPSSTTVPETTTQASPLEGAFVVAAIGIGILALHRKY